MLCVSLFSLVKLCSFLNMYVPFWRISYMNIVHTSFHSLTLPPGFSCAPSASQLDNLFFNYYCWTYAELFSRCFCVHVLGTPITGSSHDWYDLTSLGSHWLPVDLQLENGHCEIFSINEGCQLVSPSCRSSIHNGLLKFYEYNFLSNIKNIIS